MNDVEKSVWIWGNVGHNIGELYSFSFEGEPTFYKVQQAIADYYSFPDEILKHAVDDEWRIYKLKSGIVTAIYTIQEANRLSKIEQL